LLVICGNADLAARTRAVRVWPFLKSYCRK
jgi:hypothetical protein